MAYLKTGDSERLGDAIDACTAALDVDGNSVKGLYRRATAREKKGLFEEAKDDLAKAASIEPDDPAVKKLAERVDAQISRQKAKEKKMYGKMFG